MTSEENDMVMFCATCSLIGWFLSSPLFHGLLLLTLPQLATSVSISNAIL